MKLRTPIVVAVVAIIAAAGCSMTRSGTPQSGSRSAPTISATPSPTTVQQLCNAQTWPRPVPAVVGRLLYQVKDGALQCWDTVRGVAPDGHDPLNNPATPEKSYRITSVSPPPGTPIGRHDVVTVELAELDAKAPPAFRPCDWIATGEVADVIGGPVGAHPDGDEAGSVDIGCYYDKPVDVGEGVEFDLRLPGAFPVDAASEFALATTTNATTVDGLGVKAVCVHEPTTTPPSTTVVVLLSDDRLFRVTEGYASCDTLQRFARVAIGRIGA